MYTSQFQSIYDPHPYPQLCMFMYILYASHLTTFSHSNFIVYISRNRLVYRD